MANELYVLLVDPDGKEVSTKGPFAEAQTSEIYEAIEHLEKTYRLGDEVGTFCKGFKVHVVRGVYTKEYT